MMAFNTFFLEYSFGNSFLYPLALILWLMDMRPIFCLLCCIVETKLSEKNDRALASSLSGSGIFDGCIDPNHSLQQLGKLLCG